ncbi:sulfhydryl oxidase 1 [Ambystoma mexicanum]|uniref:sulfhydryl oxidase 1 n=1 Tax=Ambystoma mexicanum TaxID=8296 RepID=UPI0037E89EFB
MMPPLLLMRVLWVLLVLGSPAGAGLYSPDEPFVILDAASAPVTLMNSSSAWLTEFYASWCGHCIEFSSTWKQLARETQDWRPCIYLAALDCADYPTMCNQFNVRGYPTLKFTKAFSENLSGGTHITAARVVQKLRRQIIDNLEQHKESWPPACPPLEPASLTEIEGFFDNNNVDYLVLIFEDGESYLGREVTLDMLQFENIAVRRVLPGESLQMPHFGVKSFPSAYLIQKTGPITRIRVRNEDRTSYRKYIRSLRGVRQGTFQLHGQSQTPIDNQPIIWREADSSKVYMADLESALHYLFRVEIAKFPDLEGDKLIALKTLVSVLAEYFPGRPHVMNLLQALNSWLQNVAEPRISYSDFENVLNNKKSSLKAVLVANTTWVWCQGTRPHFRGFPCALWTLFHVLTVQSAVNQPQDADALEVLGAMRGYVKNFFGCRECAAHFESMASKSIGKVSSRDEAVVWLWSRHNEVNTRLAGARSEDPKFPKLQWPTPDLCPLCQKELAGEHIWEKNEVLHYLKAHYGQANIVMNYTEPEEELLERQRMKNGESQDTYLATEKQEVREDRITLESRGKRNVLEEEEAEEEEEEGEEEDEEEEEEQHVATQHLVTDSHLVEKHNQKPTIIQVGSKSKVEGTDIVDLDSFVAENYKRKALSVASAAKRKRRASERGLQAQPLEEELLSDFDYSAVRERLRRRGIDSKYLIGVLVEDDGSRSTSRRRWFRMIELGFSRLDLSLCIVLYFLSSMCLLAMYLYFHMKTRCRKQRASFSSA